MAENIHTPAGSEEIGNAKSGWLVPLVGCDRVPAGCDPCPLRKRSAPTSPSTAPLVSQFSTSAVPPGAPALNDAFPALAISRLLPPAAAADRRLVGPDVPD